jgi:SAM-dependent methyltransferase
MGDLIEANRQLWNTWTGLHERSSFYNLEGFRAGQLSLRPIELAELASGVAGKTLLHLMCHFGLDTLSWARLGAQVTGVDLADQAVALAQRLTAELKIPGRFVAGDVYRLPDLLDDQFDIVYCSYGILHWLPDLGPWAQVIAHFLKPGGQFYIVEDHPFFRVFASDEHGRPFVDNPYFPEPVPYALEMQGSYASVTGPDGQPAPKVHGYNWDHPIGDLLTALIAAGLRIEYLHEFDFAMRAKFPVMRQGPDGLWRLPEPLRGSIPLLFSLSARK